MKLSAMHIKEGIAADVVIGWRYKSETGSQLARRRPLLNSLTSMPQAVGIWNEERSALRANIISQTLELTERAAAQLLVRSQ